MAKFKRPIHSYPIRQCRTLHGPCIRCGKDIVCGEDYYDGGLKYRRHLVCVDQRATQPTQPATRGEE